MSGDTFFLALVRRWPRLAGRVVLMTGDTFAETDHWPGELPRCPVLLKPFTLETAATTVVRGARARPTSGDQRAGNGPRMTAGCRSPRRPTRSPRCGSTASLAPWGLRDLAALAGRHPRRLRRGAGQRRRARAAQRAHHPVLRGARAGEPARRPGHRRGLLLPPPAPGARHQAAADGRRHARDDDARVRRAHRRPDRAPGGRRRSAPALPRPDRLPLLQAPGTGRGRVGRAVLGWLAPGRGRRRRRPRRAGASPSRRASKC